MRNVDGSTALTTAYRVVAMAAERARTVLTAGTAERNRLMLGLAFAHMWVVVFVGLVWQVWWLVAGLLLLSVSQAVWPRGLYRRMVHFLPVRLEVASDRITVMASSGVGTEISRQVGHQVAYDRNRAHGPHLVVNGPADRSNPLTIRGFDLTQVREALLAHGWEWENRVGSAQGPEPSAAIPTGYRSATPSELEIVVREGPDFLDPHHPLSRALLIALAVPTVAGATLWSMWAFLAIPVGVLTYVGVGFVVTRVTVTVSADRVAVQHGTSSRSVVRRSAVASATVAKRSVRYRDEHGRHVGHVPFRQRRSDVLAALALHGWPQ